jgi:hypothetical protein
MPKRKRSPAQQAIDAAWLELAITRQTASGDAGHIEQFAGGTCDPAGTPGWFRAMELGLALDQGPSIFTSSRTLEADNRKRRRDHAYAEARDVDRPKQLARAKRMSPEESRRALRAVLRKAGVAVRKGEFIAIGKRDR